MTNPESIAQIPAFKEWEASQEAYSDASIAPGVTVYLTENATKELTRYFQEHPELEKYLNRLYLPDDETPLHHLILPKGIYFNYGQYCHIHGEAVYENGAFKEASDEFFVSINGVVRLEGKNGEVWQNWDYDQQGSKTQQ